MVFNGKLTESHHNNVMGSLLVLLLLLSQTARCVPSDEETGCKRADLSEDQKKLCPTGYVWSCSGLKLTEVPRTFPATNISDPLCVLNLANNTITSIANDSFVEVMITVRVLVLEMNRIEHIYSDAFNGLENLLELNLGYNNLTWPSPKSLDPNVFRHLYSLQELYLKLNNFTSFDGLDKEISKLTNLTQLSIDGCPSCTFGPGFRELGLLKILDVAGHGRINGSSSCHIPRVTKSLFTNLVNIQILNMFLCNITHIDEDAFSELKNITKLDLAYNEMLGFEGMANATSGLRNSSLVNFNVNNIYGKYGRSLKLKHHHIRHFRYLTNLAVLHMDLNRIEIFDEHVFDTGVLPATLEKVFLSGNRLTYDAYIKHFPQMCQLTHLDVSMQNIFKDPFYHQHFYGQHEGKLPVRRRRSKDLPVEIKLPKDLTFLNARQSLLYFGMGKFNISGPVNLTHLDLSFNLISPWTGPVHGLENLQDLNLAMNYCQNVSQHFFNGFPSLRYLNISNNLLGYQITENNEASGKTFRMMNRLETLDMSNNKLTSLPASIFNNLTKLKRINLSDNWLSGWHGGLSPCLETLDLTNNAFTSLSKRQQRLLDTIVNGKLRQCTGAPNVTVIMSQNPIVCSCNSVQFWKWTFETTVDIIFSETDHCSTEDGSKWKMHGRENIRRIYKHLHEDCPRTVDLVLTISGASFGSCVVCAVILTFVYRYRWKLRYLYHVKYRGKKRHRSQMYQRLDSLDAVCAYARDLDSFIYHDVVPLLEGEHNLKLWVFDRDCGMGSMADNIANAIANARKTILFVSKDFLNDTWCDFWMNMADVEGIETKRKLIIIVLYDNIPMKSMPKYMLRFLRTYDSITWPNHVHDQTTFWAQLADTITSD